MIEDNYDEYDYMYTNDPICPYCNCEQSEAWEWEMEDGGVEEIDCESCNKKFTVYCSVSVTYSTERKKQKENKDA